MKPSRELRRWIGMLAPLVVVSALLRAQAQPISQMVHMSWTAQDGSPQGIRAIAQTPDGLLWIGALGGLYTFDGISFKPFRDSEGSAAFFKQNFHFLLVSKTGDLWMFGFHGAPGRLHNGRLEIFDRVEGSSIEVMSVPQQAPDGTLWAVLNERQVVWLDNGVWRPVSDPQSASGHVTMLYIDHAGVMWLVVDDRLYRRINKNHPFEPTSTYVYGRNTVEEGVNHDFWIASSGPKTSLRPARHLQHLNHNGQPLPAPDIDEGLTDALPAPDGALWILTENSALLHFRQQDLNTDHLWKVREFHDKANLVAGAEIAGSRAFLRASDGSLWVGGLGGLEQFAISTLVPAIPGARIGLWRSCVDSAGTIWIDDPDQTLYRWRDAAHLDPVGKGVEDIFCSADGSVTLRDQHGLGLLRDGRIDNLPAIPGLRGYLNHYTFTGSLRTSNGSVLAAISGGAIGRSLWSFRSGHWEPYLAKQDLPEVTGMYSDRQGRVLLGFRGGNVIGVVKGNQLSKITREKPGIGTVLGFAETSYGLFAYGANGIAVDKGAYFCPVSFAKPEHASSVMGLIESKDRDVWLSSSAGVVKIASSEMKHAISNPKYPLVSNEIQQGNIPGPSFPELFSSKAHIDPSGRLWFVTLNGIVSVDPSEIRPSPLPLLSIQSISADSRSMSAKATFPPNIRMLTIDYIGVDFRNPRRVSYRYRLDGYDTAWQDAGSRTEAVYTYVRPGNYRFEVVAQNAYGAWTEPAISAPFTVLPRFYQRLWFQLFCTLLLVVLIWLLIRARLKSAETAIRERAEERADERISIARDLHDTLLQGVQGLLLTFHSAAERVPEGHESKQALEHSLATADKIILEGRDRVKGLRSQNITGNELCPALEGLGHDLNASGEINYSVSCSESENTLIPNIASEVFLIAREAIVNAFRHAQAATITVSIRCDRREFSLECQDDGRGFDLENCREQTSYGHHWGIRGMSERAERLSAAFQIRSAPGRGTLIRVTLRAKRAYE